VSLTETGHLAAAATCVVAAVVMAVRSRSTALRWAHVVLAVAMVLSAFAMHSSVVLLGCAAALVVTAAVLVARADSRGQVCAVDLTACASLAVLMAVSVLLASGGHGGPGGPGAVVREDGDGLHAAVHAAVPGAHDHQLGFGLMAVGAVLVWFVLRRRVASASRQGAAPLLMMGSMALMVAL
jgi:hypothetical protein